MKKIIVLLLLALALSSEVFANDFDGYIVKIKDEPLNSLSTYSVYSDEAALFSEMDDSEFVGFRASEIEEVTEINSDHMLVKADDIETLESLISLGIVESYEENSYMYLMGYVPENNPSYSSQKWYLESINADFAYDAGIYGNEVKVAVIDSGVYPHKDIKANLHPGKNYTVGAVESDTTDDVPHGTHVAGIIASACNDMATVGIAFNSVIVPLKVTKFNDSGEVVVSTDGAISAIYDAVDYYGCDVINMSFGATKYNQYLEAAVNHAINNGVIVVAASGNYGDRAPTVDSGVNPPVYPAYYENVVGVANAEKYGTGFRIKSSSSYNDRVDIAAPGTNILAISNNDTGTTTVSGTSFSSPMVAAAAALVKSLKPEINQFDFINLLTTTANASYISSSGQSTQKWGAGLLDIEALIKKTLEGEKYYISDVHTIGDESYIRVTNMTGSFLENCFVIISENSDEAGTKSEKLKFSLASSESTEISLTGLGFSPFALIGKYIPGDVNGDGIVNIRDASVIIRLGAGYSVSVVEEALDVNGDGVVNIRDASAILRYCAGYDVKLN